MPKQILWALVIPITVTSSTAFMFGLTAVLHWQECLMVVLGSIALLGGVLFTVLEIQRLGKQGQ